ncbi:MAG: hypothetical protein PHO29_08235 [Acetobacterium sp.]|nr:hypothetical protein [Acetobacterium sp.]
MEKIINEKIFSGVDNSFIVRGMIVGIVIVAIGFIGVLLVLAYELYEEMIGMFYLIIFIGMCGLGGVLCEIVFKSRENSVEIKNDKVIIKYIKMSLARVLTITGMKHEYHELPIEQIIEVKTGKKGYSIIIYTKSGTIEVYIKDANVLTKIIKSRQLK